jgi:hypothetical protein
MASGRAKRDASPTFWRLFRTAVAHLSSIRFRKKMIRWSPQAQPKTAWDVEPRAFPRQFPGSQDQNRCHFLYKVCQFVHSTLPLLVLGSSQFSSNSGGRPTEKKVERNRRPQISDTSIFEDLPRIRGARYRAADSVEPASQNEKTVQPLTEESRRMNPRLHDEHTSAHSLRA